MDYIKRAEVERDEDWMKWVQKIPFINFDSEWTVKPIPAFAGAMVRFQIMCGDSIISVYLDCYDKLGCYGKPYWEVYPHNGDIYRLPLNDAEELVNIIRSSIQNGDSLNKY